jgi:hypothetical protein
MPHKIMTILVCLTLMLGVTSTGTCTVLSPTASKTACEQSRAGDHDLAIASATTCHMTPCRSPKGTFLIRPDSSNRMSRTEKRPVFSESGTPVRSPRMSGLGYFQAGKDRVELANSV